MHTMPLIIIIFSNVLFIGMGIFVAIVIAFTVREFHKEGMERLRADKIRNSFENHPSQGHVAVKFENRTAA